MKPYMLIVQDIDFLCHADHTEKTESEEHEQNRNPSSPLLISVPSHQAPMMLKQRNVWQTQLSI